MIGRFEAGAAGDKHTHAQFTKHTQITKHTQFTGAVCSSASFSSRVSVVFRTANESEANRRRRRRRRGWKKEEEERV